MQLPVLKGRIVQLIVLGTIYRAGFELLFPGATLFTTDDAMGDFSLLLSAVVLPVTGLASWTSTKSRKLFATTSKGYGTVFIVFHCTHPVGQEESLLACSRACLLNAAPRYSRRVKPETPFVQAHKPQ